MVDAGDGVGVAGGGTTRLRPPAGREVPMAPPGLSAPTPNLGRLDGPISERVLSLDWKKVDVICIYIM